jgi:hypothetical protein
MKHITFAVLAAGAALGKSCLIYMLLDTHRLKLIMKTVHVSAAPTPFRILVIPSTVEEPSINGLQFGHAIPPLPMPESSMAVGEGKSIAPLLPLLHGTVEGTPGTPPEHFRHRPGCLRKVKGHPHLQIIKIKAIEISNYFRKVLGWPLIEVKHHRHHGPHHHHHNGGRGGSGAPDRVHVEGGFITLLPPSHDNNKPQPWPFFHIKITLLVDESWPLGGQGHCFRHRFVSLSPMSETLSHNAHICSQVAV